MERAKKSFRVICACLVLAMSFKTSARADDFAQDFRNSQYDGRVLVITRLDAANCVKPEPQGLRISVPNGTKGGRVGINMLAQVAGDFEVTVGVEIISLPGAGSAGLRVALNNSYVEGETLSISRGLQGGAGQFWVMARNRSPELATQSAQTTAAAASKSNQIRISRKGSSVQFAVTEGDSTDFQQLLEVTDCGANYALQISVDPSDCPEGIEARLTQLKVSGAVNVQAFLQQTARGLGFGGKSKNLGLLWWGLGAVGAVGAGAAAFRWVKLRGDSDDEPRRSRPRGSTLFRARPTPTPAEPPAPETPPEAIKEPMAATNATPEAAVPTTTVVNPPAPEKDLPDAKTTPTKDETPSPNIAAISTPEPEPAPPATPARIESKSPSRDSKPAPATERSSPSSTKPGKATKPPSRPFEPSTIRAKSHKQSDKEPKQPTPSKSADSTVGSVESATQAPEPLTAAFSPTMNENSDAAVWDEASLKSLEAKAHDFLKVNPGAVSYGERHRFRFHFQDGKLHGSFVAWWETDVEAIKAMGLKGKEIEDRLSKKFEGHYDFGQRQGRFTYWNKQGQAVAVDHEHGAAGVPYSLAIPSVADAPTRTAAITEASAPSPPEIQKSEPSSAAVVETPALPKCWDEPALVELEKKALDFLKVNPGAVSYGERHHFRFRFESGKLDGPFVVWWKMDVEAIKAMGVKGKELEDRLAKKFAGQYAAGQRHGTITYWDEQGHSGQMQYEHGRGTALPDLVAVNADVPVAAPSGESSALGEPSWDEAQFHELEQRALDFLEDNPQVQSYVERNRFRFQVTAGKLHGTFVVWRPMSPQAIDSLGANKKEVEEKLPKWFEGEYREGSRHGQFTYWDESGRPCVMDFGEHGQRVQAGAGWDESMLVALEQRADEFIEDNPDAASFAERYLFRFAFQRSKLHGSFVAWRKVDEKTMKTLGTDRKEIEENLPKRFVGSYENGRRHGTFTFWNDEGHATEVRYSRGVVQC